MFIFNQIKYIANSLFNVVFSFGIALRNLKGGTGYSAHCSQFSDIGQTIFFYFWADYVWGCFLRRFNSFPDERCIN